MKKIIILIFISILGILWLRHYALSTELTYLSQPITASIMSTSTPTPIEKDEIRVAPTVTGVQKKQTTQSQDWGCEVTGEHTTECGAPPDDRMSTIPELQEAVNAYRQAHSVGTLLANDTLCSIAQKRAEELLALGRLDGHAGMDKYAHEQQEFDNLSELLFGGVMPQIGIHIVEWGWDRSQTGHRESLLNPKWNFGCGGIAGYFVVYVLGRR